MSIRDQFLSSENVHSCGFCIKRTISPSTQFWVVSTRSSVGCTASANTRLSPAPVCSTIGPITRTVADSELIMQILATNIEEDPNVPPFGWKKQPLVRKVGVLKQFNLCKVSKANQRAMDMSIEALKKQGVEIFEIDMSEYEEELILTNVALIFKSE